MPDKYYEPSDLYELVVTEITTDFVRYVFTDGGGGFTGRQWFPNVEIGQFWLMECKRFKIVTCVRRTTPADIFRMWRRLWQDATPEQVQAITAMEFDNPSAQLARQAQDRQ